MEPTPLVSIIMTTFNEERYVSDTLKSICAQTYPHWELVIVDDGSTDNTAAIIEKYIKNDHRIRLYAPGHIGRIAAINLAIKKSKGSLIAINDADDLSRPDRLKKQVTFLSEHPKVGLVGSFADIINETSLRTKDIITAPTDDKAIRKVIVRYNPFLHSSILMRRDAWGNQDPYADTFIPGFEWELYVAIMRNWEVANIPENLVTYRIHSKSLTRSRTAWRRLSGVTRARWFTFLKLKRPWYEFPFVFSGIRDVLK